MTLAIGIDPRIKARRIAVRRAEGRRRLRFLLVAAGSVAVVVGGWAIGQSALLDLDHIRIEGVSVARTIEIESASGLDLGTPLIDVDLGAIEANLEALPWVESVDASRDWPGTLDMVITERVAVAAVPVEGGRALIDAAGVVIGLEPDALSGSELPTVAASTAVAPGEVHVGEVHLGEVYVEALAGLAVVEVIPDDLLLWVDAITVRAGSGRAVVGLDLVGSAAVDLGAVEHLDDKLAAVRSVLGAVALDCVSVIDVTVADLPTIIRDPACDVPVDG